MNTAWAFGVEKLWLCAHELLKSGIVPGGDGVVEFSRLSARSDKQQEARQHYEGRKNRRSPRARALARVGGVS